MDLTSKNRETVFKVHKKLTEIRDVSNLRFYKLNKVYVAVHWVPVYHPLPIDALFQLSKKA